MGSCAVCMYIFSSVTSDMWAVLPVGLGTDEREVSKIWRCFIKILVDLYAF